MTTTLYGIKNCDTVKKAKKWFQEQHIEFTFHDFRVDGIDSSWLANAEASVGWETLLNKRGTTYRQLDENVKANINREAALELMLAQPTLIKRPVVQSGELTLVGFKAPDFEVAFKQ